jgi:hypothetical protein
LPVESLIIWREVVRDDSSGGEVGSGLLHSDDVVSPLGSQAGSSYRVTTGLGQTGNDWVVAL